MRALPMPVLETVENQTGFTHFQYDKMGPGKSFHDIVLVKASFDISPDGIARRGRPGQLTLADAHLDPDSPLGSSLAAAGDLILHKPGCDLYFSGAARPTRPEQRFAVGACLGPPDKPLVIHHCLATGPRHWQYSLLKGWHLGEPQHALQVPILYELSFGGRKREKDTAEDLWEAFSENPAGSGYSFAGYSTADTPIAPQWESVNLKTREFRLREFVGLGPVARHWHSRAQYAGTYNKKWHAQYAGVTPDDPPPILDYPPDFDARFFQCAPPGLQSKATPFGDESLRLMGFFQEASVVDTALPDVAIVATWQQGGVRVSRALALDTIHIELPTQSQQDTVGQLHLVWRLCLPQTQGIKTVILLAGSAKAMRLAA